MKLPILSIAFIGLLFGSCSSSDSPSATAKKGEEFTFDEQKMTVDFKASTVLMNEEEQVTLVAPEGKIYLVVDVKGQNSNYFASLKDGETELEQVDFLTAKPFVRDLDLTTSPDKSMLFLVDASNTNLVVNIKSFGDASTNVSVGKLTDESTVKVLDNMKAFLKEIEKTGRVLESAKKYVKAGVNPMDIATENGEPMFGDPVTQGVSIRNIVEGNTYICDVETGIFETIAITWEGDNIVQIQVK